MNAEQGRTGIYIKLALVAAIWGSTFVAGRIVSAEMSAPFAALGRFVIATSTLLLLLLVIERGFPRLSARQWLFFIVLGVAVDLGNGNPLALITDPIGRGEVAMFGCVLGWTAYTLLGKRVMGKGISPLAATTCSALTGTAILVIVCALAGDLAMPQATLKSWSSLVYMGVVGTAVAYVWFYDGVARIGHRQVEDGPVQGKLPGTTKPQAAIQGKSFSV